MGRLEKEIERIETSDAWDETADTVDIDVKRPLAKVVPVRLSTELWEELRGEARELGIGPSTLVRMWILERLRALRQTARPTDVRG